MTPFPHALPARFAAAAAMLILAAAFLPAPAAAVDPRTCTAEPGSSCEFTCIPLATITVTAHESASGTSSAAAFCGEMLVVSCHGGPYGCTASRQYEGIRTDGHCLAGPANKATCTSTLTILDGA